MVFKMTDNTRILSLCLLVGFLHAIGGVVSLPPVILVPGDGGSRISAKLNKPNRGPNNVCFKKTDKYETLWVYVPDVLFPWATECLVDNFRLEYNRSTHKSSPPLGVDIRIPRFGDTDSVEWLNDEHFVGYYNKLVAQMVKWGYVRGKSVRGAPYDFRRAPNELGEFYTNFTSLVEDTYRINGNKKVVIVGHSLGNLVILYYLQNKPQSWKDKYIQAFVTLSGPWLGSEKTVRMVASGYNIHIWTLNALKARLMQRTMPSSAFLMPSAKYWNQTEILVQTPHKNYTVRNYEEFYADLNFTDGYLMMKDTENLVNPYQPPNVPVHCLYSHGIPTTKTIVYKAGEWPNKQPTLVQGDGDQTVSITSLEACLAWEKHQKQSFQSKKFQGIIHSDMMKNGIVIDYIQTILKTYS